MKKIIIIFILSFMITSAYTQGVADALRYSVINDGGDARFVGMGGAFGALGANVSALNTNPAGIGLFNRSEFSVTPSLDYSLTKSSYEGGEGENNRINMGFSNFGVVLDERYLNIGSGGKWRNMQAGISLNRLNNFNNRTLIYGNNPVTSIANMYAGMADGIPYTKIQDDDFGNYAFDLHPAWLSYLYDTVPGTNDSYVSLAPPGGVRQVKQIETWGSMNEISFGFAANYDDKLYFGISMGLPFFIYNEKAFYSEDAVQQNIPGSNFRHITIRENLRSSGTGFNLKLGMIYRAADWIRIGGAVHTPTYFLNILDEWSSSFHSEWDDFEPESHNSPLGSFEYDLTTPLRALGSVAFIIGKVGLVSTDYEYVDFSTAQFTSGVYNYQDENTEINSVLTSTHNFRIGTEWRKDNFSFRGGYRYFGNPYKENINDASAYAYSLGIGYRDSNMYVDIAWSRYMRKENYYLFGYGDITTNPAKNKFYDTTTTITFGLKF